MDVVTAFLNGDIDLAIFMEVPEGLRDPNNPDLVCLLLKALYGLKQAPRQWYAKIHHFLTTVLHFKSCPHEPCLYTLHSGTTFIIIILYVDDLLIAGNSPTMIKSIKLKLMSSFKMKDLGPVSEFLGIQFYRDRSKRELRISQSEYAATILDKFSMSQCSPIKTPMEVIGKPDSTPEANSPLPPDIPYRSAIGSLMYLMVCTRPDIAFAVSRLSQYCENPLLCHWKAVKRLFRYIKGTQDYDLTFSHQSALHIVGFADSDWAGCRETRKSTEGYAFLLGGGAISWRSKKQSVVALSSCEAEYVSCTSAAKEAIWLSNILAFVLDRPRTPITIKVDNQGSIGSANSGAITSRNKHIDIRYHFIRDVIIQKLIALMHIPTSDQTADIFTKALAFVLFERFRTSLGLFSLGT